MAPEDPKGPQADISILYRFIQNIQFRSGPVLGSNRCYGSWWDPSWVPTHGGWIPGFRDLTYIAEPKHNMYGYVRLTRQGAYGHVQGVWGPAQNLSGPLK